MERCKFLATLVFVVLWLIMHECSYGLKPHGACCSPYSKVWLRYFLLRTYRTKFDLPFSWMLKASTPFISAAPSKAYPDETTLQLGTYLRRYEVREYGTVPLMGVCTCRGDG